MTTPGTARWSDSLRRLFGTKHSETVGVLPDIMPVVNLLEEAWELRFYRGERRWTMFQTVGAGGAGTFARHYVGVPAASGRNRLIVIERIMASKAASSPVIAGVVPPEVAAPNMSARPLDARCGINPASDLLPTDLAWGGTVPGAVLASVSRIDTFLVPGGQPTWSPFFPGVVLAPGGCGLVIQNTTANETLDLWLQAYDVPLHGGEED